MNEDYTDIRERIPEPPQWFDENAVPRYCAFEPRRCADIYAGEAALVLITCQNCGAPFHVAFTHSSMDDARAHMMKREPWTLASLIRSREIHYGDPPNIGCCLAGPTMNSEPRRVLEYWRKADFEWERDAGLEIEIEPDWVASEIVSGAPPPTMTSLATLEKPKLTAEEERDALLAWAGVLWRGSQTLLELACDENVTDEEFRRIARVRTAPVSQEALDWARRQIS